MLVVERILVSMDWPPEAVFTYEPESKSGRRPELSVEVSESRYLFEVKAPSLLEHIRNRSMPNIQIPAHGVFQPDRLERVTGNGSIVLPRDNPIKDFLISAEEKFTDFDRVSGCNILVIVWDYFIYEPLSALVHPLSGLLTQKVILSR